MMSGQEPVASGQSPVTGSQVPEGWTQRERNGCAVPENLEKIPVPPNGATGVAAFACPPAADGKADLEREGIPFLAKGATKRGAGSADRRPCGRRYEDGGVAAFVRKRIRTKGPFLTHRKTRGRPTGLRRRECAGGDPLSYPPSSRSAGTTARHADGATKMGCGEGERKGANGWRVGGVQRRLRADSGGYG